MVPGAEVDVSQAHDQLPGMPVTLIIETALFRVTTYYIQTALFKAAIHFAVNIYCTYSHISRLVNSPESPSPATKPCAREQLRPIATAGCDQLSPRHRRANNNFAIIINIHFSQRENILRKRQVCFINVYICAKFQMPLKL